MAQAEDPSYKLTTDDADNTIMSPSSTSDATVIPIQYTTAGGRSVGMR